MDFPWELLALVLAGFIAGVINTISGGGSLITLPLLIFFGLPAAMANGTNRIALLMQNISGTLGFRSKGISNYPFSLYISLPALIGAFIGANLAVDIDDALFNRLLAIVMVVVVAFMVFKPGERWAPKKEELTGKRLVYAMIAFFFIGLYGGFIQVGVGIFILLALSSINGLSLVKSNATKLFVVLIYQLIAVATFIYYDMINWKYGLILALGNASGAWFASRWSVKKGDKLVKRFLIVTVIALAIKLWFFS
ncbi:sulfite exporter TauE/SafE family protein [Aureitalea marina]|uniref:Probable membrane transporter protein n=1 Tax=Aureitalea marina TaxID=930804 RepID=A0A2S7KTM5_9FLAO|nr:sulfite exporter TauE/SafE family protein [Aureitalea marina]PQB05946.1 integrase [Aureitalea marina]